MSHVSYHTKVKPVKPVNQLCRLSMSIYIHLFEKKSLKYEGFRLHYEHCLTNNAKIMTRT
jgi:hypothetical protein